MTERSACSASGVDIRWPGQDDLLFHNGDGASGRGDWFGGLLNEQKDASGLMYRRNRYYDPQTGRFTQEDPIGIAGGLNVYGYAAGDPVSYSDPYGLCAASQVQDAPSKKPTDQEKVCPGGLTHGEYYAREDGFGESRLAHGVAKTRVTIYFVAQENDLHVFRGCGSPIRHRELEGQFAATWEVRHGNGFWARRPVVRGGLDDMDLEVQQFYIGTVRTHYGVTRARGWVTCGTGETTLVSSFFLEDLTRY